VADDLPGPAEDAAAEAERPGAVSFLSRLAVDLTPIRQSKPLRRLWFGTGISAIGSQITTVAIPFQVYELTGSTLAVGLLAIAGLIPLLTVPLYAGAVADAVDRRRLLLFSDVALALVSVGLIANALLPNPSVAALFVAEALGTAAYGFQRPARNALTPRLVPPEQLTAALAVEDIFFNLARVAGPAMAGVLIAAIGLPGTYGVDVATFGASLVSIWLLPPIPPAHDAERASLSAILDGLRYVQTKPVLMGIFLVDTNAMVFGMPSALFPALAQQLGGGPRTVGFLYAAPYAGALAASLLSGWMTRVRRQGLGVYVAVLGWGVAIALAGLTDAILPVLVFLAFAGAADYISAVLRSVILLTATPDSMLGRLSGIELAQVAGAPAVGNLEAGVVASLTSVRFSIVSGGLLCTVGAIVIALAFPALLHYDARKERRARNSV
jgi:MFS family permease